MKLMVIMTMTSNLGQANLYYAREIWVTCFWEWLKRTVRSENNVCSWSASKHIVHIIRSVRNNMDRRSYIVNAVILWRVHIRLLCDCVIHHCEGASHTRWKVRKLLANRCSTAKQTCWKCVISSVEPTPVAILMKMNSIFSVPYVLLLP
jgi:hypothetical protein